MFLTVNARPLRRWMSQTDNRRRASSALPSPLLNININTAESGSAMSSEILATFEHEDSTVHPLEEDASDQDLLYAPITPTERWSIHSSIPYSIKSGYRGLMKAKKTL